MKILLSLALLLPLSLPAQVFTGTQLELGGSGSNQVSDSPARVGGAIGTGNLVKAPYSLAVGRSNELFSLTPPWETGNSLAIGRGNYVAQVNTAAIGDANSSFALFPSEGNSLLVGRHNLSQGGSSLTVGLANSDRGSDYDFDGASASLTVGSYNYATGNSSLIVGLNNTIWMPDGDSVFVPVVATSLHGQGLISKWNTSLVLGHYNDTAPSPSSGLLLAIGNGSDAEHRSNALEVYASGKIQMPRQGDILMGEFGNTGD